MRLKHALSRCKGKTYESCTTSKIENHKRVATNSSRSETGIRGQGGPNTTLNAWAYSEASIGMRLNPLCRSECTALGFAYTSSRGSK
jgi:hypothetical protein